MEGGVGEPGGRRPREPWGARVRSLQKNECKNPSKQSLVREIYIYVYIYIYIYIYIGGWGGESNREIVSFRVVRACVRARGAVCMVDSGKKTDPFRPFPFSLLVSQPFPFSLSSHLVSYLVK